MVHITGDTLTLLFVAFSSVVSMHHELGEAKFTSHNQLINWF